MMKVQSFINGRYYEGGCDSFIKRNPATGEIVAEVIIADEETVKKAVISAKKAFVTWSKTTLDERKIIFKKAIELLLKNQGKSGDLVLSNFVKMMNAEMGKSIYELDIEIFETADVLAYFVDKAGEILKDQEVVLNQDLWTTKRSKVIFEPIGVIGVIKPWNYPLELPIWSIGAALITGNTVVFKPSEITPTVGLMIAELFTEAGLPDGVLNVVQGKASTGKYLVNSDIDMVSFTGSTEVGKNIAKVCADKVKKLSLELGGKDAFIICKDANIERAVNGALWGSFTISGQVCVSAERVFVQEEIYDDFMALLIEKVKKLRIGHGLKKDVDITTLSSEKQLNKIIYLVNQAVEKGAFIEFGGRRLDDGDYSKGFFYEPTILSNVSTEMSCMKEETFGPIMTVVRYSSINEVIEQTNSLQYGLSASIWAENQAEAEKIAKCLQVGMVWVNDINIAFPECPWGGCKQSGYGKDLSQYGILEYTNIKHISFDNNKARRQPWWYPYGE